MRTNDVRAAKHRLQQRRWAIMARYRIWEDGWIQQLSGDGMLQAPEIAK